MYVLNEKVLSPPLSVPPPVLCSVIGKTACMVLLPWILGYSLPHLQEGLILPMQQQKEMSVPLVGGMYLLLVAASYIHNESYFIMVSAIGAVQTGLINAIRAICVFGLSSVFFCHRDSNQCYTPAKGFATVLVVSGILLFSWGRQKQQKQPVHQYPFINGKAKRTPLLKPIDPS